MPSGAWGSGSYGKGGWGGPLAPAGAGGGLLVISGAVAVVENVVRLQFNIPPYYSSILDSGDCSNPGYYSIAPVAGSAGYDGQAARPVSIVLAALAPFNVLAGPSVSNAIDLILDRPMSPYPAQYTVTAQGLLDSSQSFSLNPSPTQITFYGLFKKLQPQTMELAVPTRDFANPQNSSATAGLPNPTDATILGCFVVDETGDYALDAGLVNYKKRILRRAMTRPGGFTHLGSGYGVGIPQNVKRLGTPARRNQLAKELQRQIYLEPETEKCLVQAIVDPSIPGLVRFLILAKTKTGAAVKFEANFTNE